jgi:hypothetical protein
MTPADLEALVAEANLAPSVHNTQPTRWRIEPDGRILVLEDAARRLPVGDPTGRDAQVSHGAAIEGFALACGARGRAVVVDPVTEPTVQGLRAVARLTLAGEAHADPLRRLVPLRRTYRGAFVRSDARVDGLIADDVTLVTDVRAMADIARLNDEASLRTFRDAPYRAELVSWMRLSSRHPNWSLDGLNAEAMEMSSFEAAGAGFVLRPRVFEIVDGLGLARLLTGEIRVVRSAAAIVLFHRPIGEDPMQTGRRFYRLWLEFAALGLSAAPMAVLADDPVARDALSTRCGLPRHRQLITAFRLGVAPTRDLSPKPRLPARQLIV